MACRWLVGGFGWLRPATLPSAFCLPRPIELPLLDGRRVECGTEKPGNKLLAMAELDSEPWLTPKSVSFSAYFTASMRSRYTFTSLCVAIADSICGQIRSSQAA